MIRLLRLSFLPQSADAGLLVLRVTLGLSMLLLHGWDKLMKFGEKAPGFMSLFGVVPPTVGFGLAVFAEVFCSALLVLGFLTRFAALNLAITMSVAFFVAHGAVLKGPGSGELALVYLAGFVTLLLAGGGRYSLDRK